MSKKWKVGGLPPVGERCYVSHPRGNHDCTILGYHEDDVWFKGMLLAWTFSIDKCTFTPIKTERESLIDQMFKDAEGSNPQSGFERLHDAGYRKVKPLSFEEFRAIENRGYFREIYDTLIVNGHIIGVKEK